MGQLSDKLTQGTTWKGPFMRQYGVTSLDELLLKAKNKKQNWESYKAGSDAEFNKEFPNYVDPKAPTQGTTWKGPFMRQYGVNPDSLPSSVTEWLVEGEYFPESELYLPEYQGMPNEKRKWQTKKKTSDKEFYDKLEQIKFKQWFDSDKPSKPVPSAKHRKTTVDGEVVRMMGKNVELNPYNF